MSCENITMICYKAARQCAMENLLFFQGLGNIRGVIPDKDGECEVCLDK